MTGASAKPDKSLGQHWLFDERVLRDIAALANLNPNDTVLEIGPGLGTLTKILCQDAGDVIAVEFDPKLARELSKKVATKNLRVENADILSFDFASLPKNYKIVANIPYYITNKIIQKILLVKNQPQIAVLLVQKEVAERLAAGPGDYSVLAISAQIFAEVSLGPVVAREYFTPPPKVDSQVVVLRTRAESLLARASVDEKTFFQVVKSGFSARRKKLRSSLSGGLAISKSDAEALLASADIDPNLRAQDLSIKDWIRLTKIFASEGKPA